MFIVKIIYCIYCLIKFRCLSLKLFSIIKNFDVYRKKLFFDNKISMFIVMLNFDVYRYGYFLTIHPYLSTSIILDECDYYRYISHFINNVIITDKAIIIAIYRHIKFTDVIRNLINNNVAVLGGTELMKPENTIRSYFNDQPEALYQG